jgi:hypothetical protein
VESIPMFMEMGSLLALVLFLFGTLILVYIIHKPTQNVFSKLDIYPKMATKVGKDGKVLYFAAFGGAVISYFVESAGPMVFEFLLRCYLP